MMYGYGSMFGGVVMMVFGVLVLVAIVGVVVYVTRNVGQSNSAAPRAESPLDVLKRRYAAGEINKEQLDEMKRNLGV